MKHKHELIQTDYKGYNGSRIGHCKCGRYFLEVSTSKLPPREIILEVIFQKVKQ